LILRWVLTITYIVVLAVAILVQIYDRALGEYIFYGVLGWFVLSFFIYRLPAMNRPIGWSKKATPPADGTPLPSGSPSVALDFCTNCGTHVPPGTSVCPTCGRTIVPL
jgi:hypothetical protein